MAYTTIDDPEKYFSATLYTGNATARTIATGHQSDLVWLKRRDGTAGHRIADSVRGATKLIYSDSSTSEQTDSDSITGFVSTGFTLGDDGGGFDVNTNTNTMVAWSWKAGTTSSLSGGDITPSPYSYNATSGFGIYKYTGNGSTDQEIPHGLGKKPQMIFFKRLDSSTNWVAQSNLLGNRVQLVLNGTDAQNTDSRLGASDDWSTTIFNVGTYGDMNSSGDPHVAYAFCNIQGYSKIGTYTGNGNADGTFVYTGFKPAWVMTKRTSSSSTGWVLMDNKRETFNDGATNYLIADTAVAETDSSFAVDFLSNGFKPRTNSGGTNTSSATYIYMAFAEAPFVNSKGVPCNAR